MTAIRKGIGYWGVGSVPAIQHLYRVVTQPVNIGPLVVLRVVYGLLLWVSTVRFMAMGWIREFYVLPQFHFSYEGFGWIRPLPEWGLWLVFITMSLLALCIAAGLCYRFSTIGFFLLFTYIELLDKTYYLNHYYFISLFTFLLAFLPLNGAYALDNWLGLAAPHQMVPAWMVNVVRLQVGIVYFFAGLAKINPDWLLNALPLRIWLQARTSTPVIGQFFDYPWVAFAMSWSGMLFDVTIPFWLSWGKSRWLAYGAVVVFHSLTGILFNIGMFPWIMMACTLVFFDWQLRVTDTPHPTSRYQAVMGLFLVMFFVVQLVLPLRHVWYAGDVNWTEEGFRFAWRVMLVEKTGQATFWVRNPENGRSWAVAPSDYLSKQQEQQMSFQPDMIRQFARFIAAQYEEEVEVRAEVYVSWNGRSSRLLLDPTLNLAHPAPYAR